MALSTKIKGVIGESGGIFWSFGWGLYRRTKGFKADRVHTYVCKCTYSTLSSLKSEENFFAMPLEFLKGADEKDTNP